MEKMWAGKFFSSSSEVVTASNSVAAVSGAGVRDRRPVSRPLWSALCLWPMPRSGWRRCGWVEEVWMDAGVP